MPTGLPVRRRVAVRRLLPPLFLGVGLVMLGITVLATRAQRQALADEYANAPLCTVDASPIASCSFEEQVHADALPDGGTSATHDRVAIDFTRAADSVQLTGPQSDAVWNDLRRDPTAVVRIYGGQIASVTSGADTASTTGVPQPPATAELLEGIGLLVAGVGFLAVGVPLALRRSPAGARVDGVLFEPAARRRTGDASRAALNGATLWALGGWAAALTIVGQPVLGPLAAFVLFEMGLAAFRLAGITGRVVDDPPTGARIAAILNDVCARAGCATPAVALRDDATRPAAVRSVHGRMLLVLSRPFAQRIDDAELRGILAHEVVHIVRRDTAAARVRTVVAMVAGMVVAGVVVVVAGATDITDLPIWSAAWTVGFMGALAVVSRANRPVELRADLDAARMTGDPEALVRALQVAVQVGDEVRTALYGRPPLRWVLAPLSWRLPSHPPLAQRTAALRGLVAAAASPGGAVVDGPVAGG